MKVDKTELILGIVVLIFSMFPTQIFALAIAQWITLICGVLLILHSFAESNMRMYYAGARGKSSNKVRSVSIKKSSRSKKRRR